MEVNSKQTRSHHLSCLSGLSQQPLICNENGNERSTPISVHSMSSILPNKTHRKLDTQLLLGSASSAGLQGSVFFPTNLHHHNQQLQQSGCSKPQTPLEPSFASRATKNGRSPNSADINMNAESERNRETPAHQVSASNINISPNHSRFPKPRSSATPTLTPTTSVSFFSEHSNSFDHSHHQQHQPARRPINMASAPTTSNVNGANTGGWVQQDDNYHLYHEPLYPEDQSPTSPSAQSIPSSSEMKISTPRLPNLPQQTPPEARNSNMVITHNSINSNIINSGPSNKDWPFTVTNDPGLNKSPTAIGNGDKFSKSNPLKPISTSFADRKEPSTQRNDVSADIYSCYVTRKSSERAKHRSRSYHGPKNTTLQAQSQQSSYNGDTSRNLSSTSIADLPMSPTAFASSMVPIHFRDHCVRELIETESNYLHALDMIITCFAKPLEPLLRKEDNQLIFGHIKYFHHIHSSFQADLVKAAMRSYNRDIAHINSPALRNPALAVGAQNSMLQANSNPSTPTTINSIPQQFLAASPLLSPTAQDLPASPPVSASNKSKISSCFLNIREKFLKYGEYCATLSKAQAHLDDLTNKNEIVSAQLDRCQQDANEGKFKLRDLLSLPMQRILKYHLLLAQLIKNTSATNDDYHGLKRAYEAMVDLGQYINEVKRDTEAIQIMNDIEQSITGLNLPTNTQLTDYGRLVTDGFLRVRMPNEVKAKPLHDTKLKLPHDVKMKQKRYVFVFDKVMLMCKLSGVRGYQYKEALVLSEYDIDTNSAIPSSDMIAKHTTKEKWSYNFNLVRSCDERTYSFYAKTLEMRNKWVEAIQKAMDNIRPAACRNSDTNHEFLMHTFDKASYCDHCGKLLLGLYYQGYRCRTCFASAHKKCLASLRHCGPSLPSRLNNSQTLLRHRPRCNEPPSPSVRSNCSDDSHNNMFMHFPASNSSSTQCVDVVSRNEYSNIEDGTESPINPSSSFRENRSTSALVTHRPVSSMINVSLQNCTNPLLQQRRLLKGSNSTPSIVQNARLKAKAITDYDGNEDDGQLQMRSGDIILIHKSSVKQSSLSQDDAENAMALLNLNQVANGQASDTSTSWWLGKNTRTGKEGQFPPDIVTVLSEPNRFQTEADNGVQDAGLKANNLSAHAQTGNNHLNYILKDYPWFCGRMDRDEAQALLEKSPHGTFLVRVSTKHDGSYVISLNYSSQVKHMRIYVSRDNQLYLSQNRYFKSVTDLVSWYERNSLVESFHMLDARLTHPFKGA